MERYPDAYSRGSIMIAGRSEHILINTHLKLEAYLEKCLLPSVGQLHVHL
jgi:hypothetical protein